MRQLVTAFKGKLNVVFDSLLRAAAVMFDRQTEVKSI